MTATLQDAIRAEIGLVKTDGGTLMFNGLQSVNLPTGMVMKFAIEVGNGVIKALPDIQVNGTGTLSVSVSNFERRAQSQRRDGQVSRPQRRPRAHPA